MKVGELIELLKDFDPHLPVHIAYNYGDHWRTTVAPEVEEVEESLVRHSDYHSMPRVVESDEADNATSAVLIRPE